MPHVREREVKMLSNVENVRGKVLSRKLSSKDSCSKYSRVSVRIVEDRENVVTQKKDARSVRARK